MEKTDLWLDEAYRLGLMKKVLALVAEKNILADMLTKTTKYRKALRIIQHINAIEYKILFLNDNYRKFLKDEPYNPDAIDEIAISIIDLLNKFDKSNENQKGR